jgi:hypothetical protein
MNEVTIFLTSMEAEKFKQFQQYHDVFVLLVDKGVFDIKYGSAILNFADGQLQNLTKNEIVWRK